MNSLKFIFKTSAFVIIISAIVFSCKKKDDVPTEGNEIVTVSDNNLAEQITNDINDIGGKVSEDTTTTTYRSLPSCATITFSGATKTFTVTFDGSACSDGRVRSGSLIYNFSASTNGAIFYRHPGFKFSVSSVNYIVNGNTVNINSKTVTNTTAPDFDSSTTNLTWSIVDDITITKANNGGTINRTSTRTQTLLNTNDPTVYHGKDTAISWSKAIIGLTGSASGTASNGDNYTAAIINQLIADFNCSPTIYAGRHPFINGILDFTPGTKPTRRIDFGYPNNGQCDDSVAVSINGLIILRAAL